MTDMAASTSIPGQGEDPHGREMLAIILLSMVLFLPFLGSRWLWTHDEARVAQVARQMRQSGNWVIPRLGTDLRLRKPPLAYWLTAIASLPFEDVDEFNSRLPNILSGMGCMLLVYLFGCRLHSRHTGLLAAMILGTTSFVWWQARMTGIEIPLLFFNLLALYSWWRSREERERSSGKATPWLLLCYFMLGLSFLQKGPVGPLLLLSIIIVWLFAARQWKIPGAGLKAHLAGIAIFTAISLPWYLLVLARLPEAWDVWLNQTGGRLEGYDHVESPLYLFKEALADGQPWIIPALLGIAWVMDKKERRNRQNLLPVTWAAVTLIFFSIFASKQSHYILPLYPATALLAAVAITAAPQKSSPLWLKRGVSWFFQALGGVLFLLLAAGIIMSCSLPFMDNFDSGTMNFLIVALAATAICGSAMIWQTRAVNYQRVMLWFIAAFTCLIILYGSILPQLNPQRGVKHLAERIKPRLTKADDQVINYGISAQPMMKYELNRHVSRRSSIIHLQEKLAEKITGRLFILAGRKEWQELPEGTRKLMTPLEPENMEEEYFWVKKRAVGEGPAP